MMRRFLSSRVNINGDSFKVKKITRIKARPSIFYLKYPYVIELTYHKPWTEIIWIYNAAIKTSIPTVIHHEHQHFKYKYLTKEEVCQDFDKLYESGVTDSENLIPS